MSHLTIAICGHVDSGKTTFIDAITNLNTVNKEPGRITQKLSIYEVDTMHIINYFELNEKLKSLQLPNKVFLLDTPGHEAFQSIKIKSMYIADIIFIFTPFYKAVNESCFELIKYAIKNKINYIVVFTYLDKLKLWRTTEKGSFRKNIEYNKEAYEDAFFEKRMQFNNYNLNLQLYGVSGSDCVFTAVSNLSQEGYKDIFTIILYEYNKKKSNNKGIVLLDEEVGNIHYLTGILYSGTLTKGICNIEDIEYKIKRVYSRPYQGINSVNILKAPGVFGIEADYDSLIKKENKGLILKAKTKGALEGLYKKICDNNWPVLLTEVGPVSKLNKCIIKNETPPFNKILSLSKGVDTDVEYYDESIFKLVEKFEKSLKEYKQELFNKFVAQIGSCAYIEILPTCVFKDKPPYVVGFELKEGFISFNAKVYADEITLQFEKIQVCSENCEIVKIKGTKFAAKFSSATDLKEILAKKIFKTRIKKIEYDKYKDLEELSHVTSDMITPY